MDRSAAIVELVGIFNPALKLARDSEVRANVEQRRNDALMALGVTPAEIEAALVHIN